MIVVGYGDEQEDLAVVEVVVVMESGCDVMCYGDMPTVVMGVPWMTLMLTVKHGLVEREFVVATTGGVGGTC